MTVEMVPVDAIRSKSVPAKPERFQSLTVILRGKVIASSGQSWTDCWQRSFEDELVHGLHIGQHCSVIGIPVYDVVEVQGHWVGNVCIEVRRGRHNFRRDYRNPLLL